MPRTTLDLDTRVLRALKRRKQATGRSIGQIASELLAGALDQGASHLPSRSGPALRWRSARMGARVNLDDKEAVARALEDR